MVRDYDELAENLSVGYFEIKFLDPEFVFEVGFGYKDDRGYGDLDYYSRAAPEHLLGFQEQSLFA